MRKLSVTGCPKVRNKQVQSVNSTQPCKPICPVNYGYAYIGVQIGGAGEEHQFTLKTLTHMGVMRNKCVMAHSFLNNPRLALANKPSG
jgi:hypothetical protein